MPMAPWLDPWDEPILLSVFRAAFPTWLLSWIVNLLLTLDNRGTQNNSQRNKDCKIRTRCLQLQKVCGDIKQECFPQFIFYNLIYVYIYAYTHTHTYMLNQEEPSLSHPNLLIPFPLKKKKEPFMVLLTSVASSVISFKLGYLINMSVWSSDFFCH